MAVTKAMGARPLHWRCRQDDLILTSFDPTVCAGVCAEFYDLGLRSD